MDRQLAERMVGAAVLLTVLVLVVPALLDGGAEEPSGSADAPLPPVLEVAPVRTIRIEGQDDRGPPVPEARVPPAPVIPPAASPASEPMPAEAVAAVEGPEPAPAPADPPAAPAAPQAAPSPAPADVKPPPAASAPAAAPAPAGDWVVQLGSFASGPNAERLAGQVRAKGFAATVSETGTGSARRYRVRSGAATTREVADRLAADIKAAGFQVTVVRR